MSPPRRTSNRTTALLASATLLFTIGALSAPAGAQESERGRPGGDAPALPAVEFSETFADGPRHLTASDGTIYSPLEEPSFILGHDNGQSTLYDNGEGLRFSYWSFGDTGLSEPNSDGKNFLGNTAARTSDLDMSDNVAQWDYDGDANGPQEAWKLNADEEAWNALHADTDPDTAGCQPAEGVDWMDCGNHFAIWGAGIAADPGNERILSFYNLIRRFHVLGDKPNPAYPEDPDAPPKIPCTDEDVADRNNDCRKQLFDGVGQGVAVWTETEEDGDGWERMNITNATDPSNPTALWPYDDDHETQDTKFDNALFIDGGYVYAYGCFSANATDCGVSRVSLRDPEDVWDRDAWRFFAGHDLDERECRHLWSADVECTVPLEVDTDGGPAATLNGGAAGSSVFWNPELRVYMWIHSRWLSNEIQYRVAHRPEGPWSEPGLLGMAVPSDGEGLGALSYAGFAHPEYAEENGLVQYVTYAHTTGFLRGDMPMLKVRFADPDGG